jgi:hypothetical protein
MSIEGDITVRIDVRDGAVAAVGIDSTRPAVAGRVLSGKSVGDAVALVPRLYSICGRAPTPCRRNMSPRSSRRCTPKSRLTRCGVH